MDKLKTITNIITSAGGANGRKLPSNSKEVTMESKRLGKIEENDGFLPNPKSTASVGLESTAKIDNSNETEAEVVEVVVAGKKSCTPKSVQPPPSSPTLSGIPRRKIVTNKEQQQERPAASASKNFQTDSNSRLKSEKGSKSKKYSGRGSTENSTSTLKPIAPKSSGSSATDYNRPSTKTLSRQNSNDGSQSADDSDSGGGRKSPTTTKRISPLPGRVIARLRSNSTQATQPPSPEQLRLAAESMESGVESDEILASRHRRKASINTADLHSYNYATSSSRMLLQSEESVGGQQQQHQQQHRNSLQIGLNTTSSNATTAANRPPNFGARKMSRIQHLPGGGGKDGKDGSDRLLPLTKQFHFPDDERQKLIQLREELKTMRPKYNFSPPSNTNNKATGAVFRKHPTFATANIHRNVGSTADRNSTGSVVKISLKKTVVDGNDGNEENRQSLGLPSTVPTTAIDKSITEPNLILSKQKHDGSRALLSGAGPTESIQKITILDRTDNAQEDGQEETKPKLPAAEPSTVSFQLNKGDRSSSSSSSASQSPTAERLRRDREEDEGVVGDSIVLDENGRFLKFAEELGRGSFKTVFKGLDTENGVEVAWCELQDSRLNKAERHRFREEAEMLKGLQHPNIVRFYDYWEKEDPTSRRKYIVLVTEKMTNGTLKAWLKRFKKIHIGVLKSYCRQILKGLNFMHTRTPPIIHRDLKCDNIFIAASVGVVKIGDLGLATLKNKSYAKSVIGTPEFMAPEMYEEQYDEAVDVYAFGMCLLEMVTGEYPYSECQFPAQIYKRVTGGVKPQCFDRIPSSYPEIREIVERCTKLRGGERYTVKELLIQDFLMPEELIELRVEVENRDEILGDTDNTEVQMLLRVLSEKKRKDYRQKENEAISFWVDMNKDKPEDVAKELLEAQFILEEDWRTTAKLIQNRIKQLQTDQELYRKERMRKREEDEKAKEQQELEQELKEWKESKRKEKEEKERNELQQQQQQEYQQNQSTSTGNDGSETTRAPLGQALSTNTSQGSAAASQSSTAALLPPNGLKLTVLAIHADHEQENSQMVTCKLETHELGTCRFKFSTTTDRPESIVETLAERNLLPDKCVDSCQEILEKVVEKVQNDREAIVSFSNEEAQEFEDTRKVKISKQLRAHNRTPSATNTSAVEHSRREDDAFSSPQHSEVFDRRQSSPATTTNQPQSSSNQSGKMINRSVPETPTKKKFQVSSVTETELSSASFNLSQSPSFSSIMSSSQNNNNQQLGPSSLSPSKLSTSSSSAYGSGHRRSSSLTPIQPFSGVSSSATLIDGNNATSGYNTMTEPPSATQFQQHQQPYIPSEYQLKLTPSTGNLTTVAGKSENQRVSFRSTGNTVPATPSNYGHSSNNHANRLHFELRDRLIQLHQAQQLPIVQQQQNQLQGGNSGHVTEAFISSPASQLHNLLVQQSNIVNPNEFLQIDQQSLLSSTTPSVGLGPQFTGHNPAVATPFERAHSPGGTSVFSTASQQQIPPAGSFTPSTDLGQLAKQLNNIITGDSPIRIPPQPQISLATSVASNEPQLIPPQSINLPVQQTPNQMLMSPTHQASMPSPNSNIPINQPTPSDNQTNLFPINDFPVLLNPSVATPSLPTAVLPPVLTTTNNMHGAYFENNQTPLSAAPADTQLDPILHYQVTETPPTPSIPIPTTSLVSSTIPSTPLSVQIPSADNSMDNFNQPLSNNQQQATGVMAQSSLISNQSDPANFQFLEDGLQSTFHRKVSQSCQLTATLPGLTSTSGMTAAIESTLIAEENSLVNNHLGSETILPSDLISTTILPKQQAVQDQVNYESSIIGVNSSIEEIQEKLTPQMMIQPPFIHLQHPSSPGAVADKMLLANGGFDGNNQIELGLIQIRERHRLEMEDLQRRHEEEILAFLRLHQPQ